MSPLQPYEEVQAFKEKIIDNTLLVGTSVGFVTYLVANIRILNGFIDPLAYIELVFLFTLLLVYLMRDRLAPRIKALTVTCVLLAFIVTDTMVWGPFSQNNILIVIVPFYALLVYNLWQTLILFFISICAYFIPGYLHLEGIIDGQLPPFDKWFHSTRYLVINSLLISVVATIVVTFTKLFNNSHEKLISNLDEKNKALMKREKALQREQHFINDVLDSMPGLFNLFKKVDGKFELVRWNKNTTYISGLTKEELLGQDPLYIIHPDYREKIGEIVKNISFGQRDSAAGKSYHVRNKDISRWFYFSGLPTTFDNEEYFIGTGIDISDQKEAERLFKEEKAFSLRLLDIIPGIFYLFEKINDQYILKRWNRNLELHTGYSAEELTQIKPIDLIVEEYRQDIKDSIDALENNKSLGIEAPMMKKNDRGDYWYLVNKKFKEDDREYLLGVGIDIADRKVMERELEHRNLNLKDMLDDLQSRNTKLAEYAFINSHLLRAPLARLIGLAQLVTKEVNIGEHQSLIQNFQTSAEEIDTIVTQINEILDQRKDLNRDDILRALGKISSETFDNN